MTKSLRHKQNIGTISAISSKSQNTPAFFVTLAGGRKIAVQHKSISVIFLFICAFQYLCLYFCIFTVQHKSISVIFFIFCVFQFLRLYFLRLAKQSLWRDVARSSINQYTGLWLPHFLATHPPSFAQCTIRQINFNETNLQRSMWNVSETSNFIILSCSQILKHSFGVFQLLAFQTQFGVGSIEDSISDIVAIKSCEAPSVHCFHQISHLFFLGFTQFWSHLVLTQF